MNEELANCSDKSELARLCARLLVLSNKVDPSLRAGGHGLKLVTVAAGPAAVAEALSLCPNSVFNAMHAYAQAANSISPWKDAVDEMLSDPRCDGAVLGAVPWRHRVSCFYMVLCAMCTPKYPGRNVGSPVPIQIAHDVAWW